MSGKRTTHKHEMKCYFCSSTLRWDNDFSFSELGIEDEEGSLSYYTCDNCGAEYEIYKPFTESRGDHS